MLDDFREAADPEGQEPDRRYGTEPVTDGAGTERWIANNAVKIVSVSGKTTCSRLGEMTSSPSTAERTEIAGVIIPSP